MKEIVKKLVDAIGREYLTFYCGEVLNDLPSLEEGLYILVDIEFSFEDGYYGVLRLDRGILHSDDFEDNDPEGMNLIEEFIENGKIVLDTYTEEELNDDTAIKESWTTRYYESIWDLDDLLSNGNSNEVMVFAARVGSLLNELGTSGNGSGLEETYVLVKEGIFTFKEYKDAIWELIKKGRSEK